MVIAVDFDGTLCEHKFPEIGEQKDIHKRVWQYIKNAKVSGDIIILWTCREDLPERKYLTEAVEWCKQHDIPIDFVNEYPMSDFKGFASRKVCADIYIDDKAVSLGWFKEDELMARQTESIKKIIDQGNKPYEKYYQILDERIKRLRDIGEKPPGYEKDIEIQKIKDELCSAGIIDVNGNLGSKYRDDD